VFVKLEITQAGRQPADTDPAARWQKWVRKAARWSSPAGARARLSILIYHRVLADEDPLNNWDPTDLEFEDQIRTLSACFTMLPLGEALERLASESLPPSAACVTFDDGYADNVAVALPILKKHGVPAIFFVATGYLDGGRMWNDTVVEAIRACSLAEIDLHRWGMGTLALGDVQARRRAIRTILDRLKQVSAAEREARAAELGSIANARLPQDLMMRTDQVSALRAAGMEIGAHSVTHPILTQVSYAAARKEIAEGRECLSAILREPVSFFAYPNGKPGRDYTGEHVAMVRELGFRAAVSTAWGVATKRCDWFQLPRFTPWDRNPTKFALRLLLNRRNARPTAV
jgi:peptidoglycan/xylan/chitin deacetylase (PgdA/CDA1 family)